MFIEDMESKIFKALAHPTRLKIIQKLSNGELCVCELNEEEELSQSNLSQHLKILRDSDILIHTKDGSRVNYKIKNPEILKIIEIVDSVIKKELDLIKTNLEKGR